MLEDRSRAAYSEVKGIPLAYVNRFVVTLTNGFAEEGSGTVYELQEDELCRLLDRIIDSYNDFLVRTYVDRKLPADAFSCIDTGNLDLMESLDQLQEATAGLDSYCAGQPRNVRRYRSWRTGLTLNDLMRKLSRLRRHDLGYLSAWVFANGITDDREEMLINYRYELRNLESDREAVLLEEIYHEIRRQMEEILDVPVCTRYAEHTAQQVVSQ